MMTADFSPIGQQPPRLPLLTLISMKSLRLGTIVQFLSADFTLDNYQRVLADPSTWQSLWISTIYIFASSAIAFAIGLLTALVLNERFPAQRLFRTLLLLPWAVPGITATVAFLWMLQPSFGVFNFMVRSTGLIEGDINWFGDTRVALAAVVFPTVWKTYPFFTIMLLAALQTIPRDMYEAASIDGANGWAKFRYITWPSISRYAIVALVFNAMYVFREFDFIFASTKGGPLGATTTVSIKIYNVAFESFDMASAATLGVLTFILIGVCVYWFMRCLWVALWDGWKVARYTPGGKLDREIIMPIPRPTSCCFGGDGLRTLYITSARIRLSRETLREAPLSGGLFALELDTPGIPTNLARV